jgi:hypothetical protein
MKHPVRSVLRAAIVAALLGCPAGAERRWRSLTLDIAFTLTGAKTADVVEVLLGKLWIADAAYSRLLRYGSGGWSGQLDLGRTAGGTSVVPAALAVGDDGSLWILTAVAGRLVHLMPR